MSHAVLNFIYMSVLFQVENIRAILKKELDVALVEIADPEAKLEGGDVLFTGKEFFVGISEYTNMAGALAVARAFPEFPCVPIKVSKSLLSSLLSYSLFMYYFINTLLKSNFNVM